MTLMRFGNVYDSCYVLPLRDSKTNSIEVEFNDFLSAINNGKLLDYYPSKKLMYKDIYYRFNYTRYTKYYEKNYILVAALYKKYKNKINIQRYHKQLHQKEKKLLSKTTLGNYLETIKDKNKIDLIMSKVLCIDIINEIDKYIYL